jgi:hypothetical protein
MPPPSPKTAAEHRNDVVGRQREEARGRMSDPVVPVERGLRATVRLAAGINIGETSDESSVLHTASERLHGAISAAKARFGAAETRDVAALPDAPATLAPAKFAPAEFAPVRAADVLRHAGWGAAAGSVIVACGFAFLAARAGLEAAPQTREVALTLTEAAVKADRLALPPRSEAVVASIGATVPPAGELASDREAGTLSTASLPTMAFASAGAGERIGAAAIDRMLDAPPIAATPPTDEEEDDEAVVPLVLPMPRARPEIEVAVLPIPRPRPLVLASLTPPSTPIDPVEPRAAVAKPRTEEPDSRPPGLLGFFSSPTDPVKPPARTKVDTPFGVPYVLQTGSVETACLKPELVDVLRRIEGHYKQKVVITSGFRDRGRQGSLHRQCAAADIEVPGVSSTSLAAFARTIPGIGGVGTYCHSMMIHVDIGTPRDWKYGCGSFFAMRGGTGKWGKVPPNLAKSQAAAIKSTGGEDTAED